MLLKFFLRRVLITTALMSAFFLAPFCVNDVFALVDNINKIVFTTNPQTINMSEASKEITVQAWNDSENKGEKMDVSGGKLSLVSSSHSGEFSASSTKWEKIITPLTINSNWTGRTFYYKNLEAGADIITATLTVGGETFVASQSIIINDSDNDFGSSTTTDNTSTSTQATSTQATSTSDTSTSTNSTTTTKIITRTVIQYVSTHSNPEDLSDYSNTIDFEISAGRERVGYIGVPVKFSAKNNSSKIPNCSSPNYVWAYGDGSKDTGENISHTYKFPGEYNIVLNGTCGSESAVSRTKIKILSPEVSFGLIPSGDLEIYNLGETEINMGGCSVVSSSTEFVIPEDTIISALGKIILSKEYSKILINNNEVLSLINPSKEIIFSSSNNTKVPELVFDTTQSLPTEFSKEEVDNFTTAFFKNSKKENIATLLSPEQIAINTKEIPVEVNTTSSPQISEAATILESTQNLETKGFWKNLVSLPVRGIKAVARVFYDVD